MVPNRNRENLSEPKPSIFEPWFGSGSKNFEPKSCRNRRFRTVSNQNREKSSENREIKSEPQKTGGSELWEIVKNHRKTVDLEPKPAGLEPEP